jgi:hypothetical protein
MTNGWAAVTLMGKRPPELFPDETKDKLNKLVIQAGISLDDDAYHDLRRRTEVPWLQALAEPTEHDQEDVTEFRDMLTKAYPTWRDTIKKDLELIYAWGPHLFQ